MRKLILHMQTSVDGYVGRAGEGPEWQVWDWSPELTWTDALLARFNRFFEEADCIVLSSKIAGGYLDHWTKIARRFPRNSPFAFAHRIVEIRKIVFSKSGHNVTGPNVEMAKLPLAAEVAALKREPGGNIVAFGGAGFAAALIAERLVDEFQFYVNSAVLGDGLSIFEKNAPDNALKLVDAEAYACGIAVTRYQSSEAAS
ncbi:dihydrofolate reductase family protein (plasmid) [Mesorhizobium sp. AR07]|uniref:dihydrofolate reductase family protein n=1 Tax=Mesorhizobium sp. AR07 TaxID=2865838 RepID=UPI00215E4DD5|nr:dihydrofolate reductase family protein [Mesorhizobium sp. AR07]UVK49415.1 dihydrofolate reductase family protein [Mesorhizobium sp. AR07]